MDGRIGSCRAESHASPMAWQDGRDPDVSGDASGALRIKCGAHVGARGQRRIARSTLPAHAHALAALMVRGSPHPTAADPLCSLRLASPDFAPNFFVLGVLFGLPAGLLEEIGWTGFAFPRMQHARGTFAASVLLGVLWSLWHLPVIDHLGTATPHRDAWVFYFAAFGAAMTAMRVLIGWLYANTKSVFLAQLMHVSSTGSLVVFSAPRVSSMQEAAWYGVYAIALWLVVLVLRHRLGSALTRCAA